MIRYNRNGTEKSFNPLRMEDDELVVIYCDLKSCKNFAINKSYRRYYNLPIERDDLEWIAWCGFKEAVDKYDSSTGQKSFESFMIDAITWKCNDYCESYLTNRHKVLNVAYTNKNNDRSNINDQNSSFKERVAIESVIEQYMIGIKNLDKLEIAKAYLLSFETPKHIARNTAIGRTKVYRLVREISNELAELLI
ncbi:hypothetical protein [Mesoplasma lactucae]|uniref:hypothetical protein n=1 Tax=Mesoplasma lactucae TaxID=138853 RepID=UPI0012FD8ABE|nr:hypothetical protein [Mesoplasma lactucae]